MNLKISQDIKYKGSATSIQHMRYSLLAEISVKFRILWDVMP
jgi:hypothetical protein